MMFRRVCGLGLSALALGLVLGCNAESERPKTFPVSGKVTYQGKPVPKGTVTFQSDAGQTATGQIKEDGTYTLSTFEPDDGAVEGHHAVGIIANDGDPHMMPGSSPGYKPPKDLVPKKYGKPGPSGLEATVSADKAAYDFDLK